MQGDAPSEHQDQPPLPIGAPHVFLHISGRGPQTQLHRSVRTGLGAGHAQNAIAVVTEVSRVCPQRTALRGQSLSLGWTSLEAGIAVAAATAGARFSPQFQN